MCAPLRLRWLVTIVGAFFFTLSDVRAQPVTIYWTDTASNAIFRANADGSGLQRLVMLGDVPPQHPAIVPVDQKMHWVVTDPGTSTHLIQRADLTGQNVEDVATGFLGTGLGIAIDAEDRRVYWTSQISDWIRRADLDGSNVEELVFGGDHLEDIEIDPVDGMMYSVDFGCGAIHRAKLDGSNPATIVTGLLGVRGIDIDVTGRKLYWTNINTVNGPGKMQRSNLDGTSIEDLVTLGVNGQSDIVVDSARGTIFWTDVLNGKIQSSNLDGSDVQDIFVMPGSAPFGIDAVTFAAAPVPVASTWALNVATLPILTAGTIVLASQRQSMPRFTAGLGRSHAILEQDTEHLHVD